MRQYHTSTRLAAASRIPEQNRAGGNRSHITFNNVYKFNGSAANATRSPAQANNERFVSIHPLLCLSLQPHVYLPDYGIMGKEAYIKNFWKNVDWAQAERRYLQVKDVYKGGAQRTRYAGSDSLVRYPMESMPPAEGLNPEHWKNGSF